MLPLDIFKENFYNKGIKNPLDAWLAFFSFDTPEQIIQLIEAYPEFRPIYQHIYDICENVERMITMFSKELALMDRNTTLLMIDDLTAQVKAKDVVLAEKDAVIADKDAAIADKDAAIADMRAALDKQNALIETLYEKLEKTEAGSSGHEDGNIGC